MLTPIVVTMHWQYFMMGIAVSVGFVFVAVLMRAVGLEEADAAASGEAALQASTVVEHCGALPDSESDNSVTPHVDSVPKLS